MTAKKLISSPLFKLSMTNKELFHSNFIAWFGEEYPVLFCRVVNLLLDEKSKGWTEGLQEDNFEIRREHRHYDISVYDNSGNVRLVIENKIKSIPTRKQLKEYEESVQAEKSRKQYVGTTAFLLLTMTKDFQYEESADCESRQSWIIVDYHDFVNALKTCIAEIPVEYHRALVEDFCCYMQELQSLILKYSSSKYFITDESKKKILNSLGVEDVVQKRIIQRLYSIVLKGLTENGYDMVSSVEQLEVKPKCVCLKWGYSNMSMLTIFFRTRHGDDVFEIQIQDKQYRHGVELYEKEVGDRIEVVMSRDSKREHRLSNKGFTYCRDTYGTLMFSKEALRNYPDFNVPFLRQFGQRKKSTDVEDNCSSYCKYAPTYPLKYANNRYACFAYQWIRIPYNVTIIELSESIISDLNNVQNVIYNNRKI